MAHSATVTVKQQSNRHGINPKSEMGIGYLPQPAGQLTGSDSGFRD
jgi:hypothetical protein